MHEPMSTKGQKRTFQSFRLTTLIPHAKCFTSGLRIDPYSTGLFCALVKQVSNSSGTKESAGATSKTAATALVDPVASPQDSGPQSHMWRNCAASRRYMRYSSRGPLLRGKDQQ